MTLRAVNVVDHREIPFGLYPESRLSPGARWEIEISVLPEQRAEAQRLEAFLLSLRGRAGLFRCTDPSYSLPMGSNLGIPLVKSALAGEEAFESKGWSASEGGLLKAGDFIEIEGRLHRVLQDVNSDAVGEAVIHVWPPLRQSHAENVEIVAENARGVFSLVANTEEFTRNAGGYNGSILRAVEVLTPAEAVIAPIFSDGDQVNFRGNSLTLGADAGNPLYLGIDLGVAALLEAAGRAPGVFGKYASDGLSFTNHAPGGANAAASLASVVSTEWDIGVLQDLSSAATDTATHIAKGKILAGQYFTNNGNARVLLYETPAYKHGSSNYPALFASASAMRAATWSAYHQLREGIDTDNPAHKPALVVPVGSALYYGGRCLPPTHRQYRALTAGDDDIHHNPSSYTIACLVFYCVLTGADPDGLLDSSEWAAIEAQMISAPALDRRWMEAHAYSCAKGVFPILFLEDPVSQSAVLGGDVSFSVEVDGSGPITYQWFKGSSAIPGANSATLEINSVTSLDFGSYKCRVENAAGRVESLTATLAEIPAVPEILVNFTRFGFTVGSSGGKTYNDREAPNGDNLTTLAGQSWSLVSTSNVSTPIHLHLDSAGADGGANSIGPTGVGTWPNNATSTFWVGGTGPSNVHTLRLSGFTPGAAFLFEIRGWRALDGSARQTRVVVTDAGGDRNIDYNAGANSTDLISIEVMADVNGEIAFRPQIGAGNTVNFFYYGLLRIAPLP